MFFDNDLLRYITLDDVRAVTELWQVSANRPAVKITMLRQQAVRNNYGFALLDVRIRCWKNLVSNRIVQPAISRNSPAAQ